MSQVQEEMYSKVEQMVKELLQREKNRPKARTKEDIKMEKER